MDSSLGHVLILSCSGQQGSKYVYFPQRNITCLRLANPEAPRPGRHRPWKAPPVILSVPSPQPHTPHPHPEPLSCLASPSEGFRESELTSSCAWSLWTVSPDSNGFAFSPWNSGAYHTASHKVGAQQGLVTRWSPSSSSKAHFSSLPSPNRLWASQTSCASCGMPVYCFPPDPS